MGVDARVNRLVVSPRAGAAGQAEWRAWDLKPSSFGLGEAKSSPDGQVQGVHV